MKERVFLVQAGKKPRAERTSDFLCDFSGRFSGEMDPVIYPAVEVFQFSMLS